MVSPTEQLYGPLVKAYNFFNLELFNNKLPEIIFTLQNKGSRIGGFYVPQHYRGRQSRQLMDEIVLNPLFFNLSIEDILANLVHQMTLVWQQHLDKPSRPGYHNRAWAKKMREIGLHPSSTGAPGGKETGQTMHHYMIQGGDFQKSSQKLLNDGFRVQWAETLTGRNDKSKSAEKKATGRIPWSCPRCLLKAWAKPSAHLVCGACLVDLETP